MQKYLFELDSALGPEWSPRMQRKILSEVVVNGNRIVLSSNQIIDSSVLKPIISTGFSNTSEYGKARRRASTPLEIFLLMIDEGIIMYSTFDKLYTPSQFVQSTMEKDDKANEFIFTSMPWLNKTHGETEDRRKQRLALRKDLAEALKYNDVRLFRRNIGNYPDFTEEQIAYMESYIRLIFRFSEKGVEAMPRKGSPSLRKLIKKIADERLGEEWEAYLSKIRSILDTYTGDEDDLNFRSKWFNQLSEERANKRIDADFEEKCKKIIDACYNYCILFSINNVSCEYSIDYRFPEAVREVLDSDDSPDNYEALSDSEWALLKRVVAKYKRGSFVDEDAEGTLGSPFMDKVKENRTRWRNHLTSTLLHGLAVPFAYVVAVVLIIIGEKISGDILEDMPLGGTGVFALIAMIIPFIPDIVSEAFNKLTDRATGYTGLASGLRDGWTVIKDMTNIKRMMGRATE